MKISNFMPMISNTEVKKQKYTENLEPKEELPEISSVKGIAIQQQNIFIQIDDEANKFYGYTEIMLSSLPEKFSSKKEFLSVDSKQLTIHEVQIDDSKSEFQADETNHKIILKGDVNPLSVIKISFEGNILGNMQGIYISKYTNPENKKEMKLFSTHFEPSYAREAFPTFDHPILKTKFKISISADKKYKIISNSEEAVDKAEDKKFEEIIFSKNHIKKEENYKTVHFEETPKMSTYLVAFVVGDLKKIGNDRTEIYSPYQIENLEFAFKVADFALNFFEKMFGEKYAMKKLKHVAIPEFSMGAMENWGLVTYRTTSLMFSATSSLRAKNMIMLTVIHEIAHQWFGNLVTMKWWDDLWLNEGFATWCEMFATDFLIKHQGTNQGFDVPQLNLKYDAWTDFISETTNPGLNMDVMDNSHPVHVHVSEAEQIEEIFDAISYNKGSSLIRMMKDYVGEFFHENLEKYINKFKFDNAEKDDLFDTLNLNSTNDKSIGEIMNNWITKKGFPLIIVNETNDDHLELTQHLFSNGLQREKEIKKFKNKFFLDLKRENIEEFSNSAPENLFPVPIKINWGENIKENYLLTEKTMKIKKLSDKYVVNDNKIGFFRVFYENPIPQSLVEFEIGNVISFLVDYFALAKNGYIGLEKYLNNVYFKDSFAQYFSNYYFLREVFGQIASLKSIFPEKKQFFNSFLRNFLKRTEKLTEVIDFPLNERFDDHIMRLNVLKVAIVVEIAGEDDLEEIYNLFSSDKIDPAYLGSKYLAIMKYKNNFDEILKIALEGDLGEQVAAKQNLGSSLKEDVYEKAMNLILTNEIKAGDKLYLAHSLLNNSAFNQKFCKFVFEKFEKIWEAYMKNSSLFSRLLENCISISKEVYWEGIVPFKGTESAFKKGIEKFKIKKIFRSKNLKYLKIE